MTKSNQFLLALFVFYATLVASVACAQSPKVALQSDKMIEVGFLKVKAGQQKALSEDYFPKAIKIAKDYGVKPLVTFRVSKVDHGPADSVGMWGMFEWPSIAKKRAFERDPRFVELRAYRDSLLVAPPKLFYTKVTADIDVELLQSGAYEAAVVWVNPERGAHLQEYFKAVGPFVKQHDVKFLGEFKIIGEPDEARYRFESRPSKFLFIQWPDWKTKKKWFTSESFAKSGHHRALALDRLLVVESSANL